MLVDETENDVDKCILDKKNAYIVKLKKMKELNRQTTDELTQDKIHYNLYVQLLILYKYCLGRFIV